MSYPAPFIAVALAICLAVLAGLYVAFLKWGMPLWNKFAARNWRFNKEYGYKFESRQKNPEVFNRLESYTIPKHLHTLALGVKRTSEEKAKVQGQSRVKFRSQLSQYSGDDNQFFKELDKATRASDYAYKAFTKALWIATDCGFSVSFDWEHYANL